jgi:hypothetical protein
MIDSRDPTNAAPSVHDRGGHRWMMAMCVSMLLIAALLVGTGVASSALLFAAVGCMAMMAVMMYVMMRAMGPANKSRQQH